VKLYQHDKQTYQDGEVSHTWQFGIIKNKSLLWVSCETPGKIIHSSGGINILFSFFGSSLMSVDLQQRRFGLAFGFFTEYFDGWSNNGNEL
jgi:hypothetical protein